MTVTSFVAVVAPCTG